jgi:hypothetical protein
LPSGPTGFGVFTSQSGASRRASCISGENGLQANEEVQTWVAPGAGPVKSSVSRHASGNTVLTSTDELLSFTKG